MEDNNIRKIKFYFVKFYQFPSPPWHSSDYNMTCDTFKEAEDLFLSYHSRFYNCKCYDDPQYDKNKKITVLLPENDDEDEYEDDDEDEYEDEKYNDIKKKEDKYTYFENIDGKIKTYSHKEFDKYKDEIERKYYCSNKSGDETITIIRISIIIE